MVPTEIKSGLQRRRVHLKYIE